MANFSNYYESGILNYIFRANTNNFARPSSFGVALCTNLPAKTQTGSTIPELPNANGYARATFAANVNTAFTEINTINPANSGNITNIGSITFPAATADWGMVSGIAICDSGGWGAGNVICYGALATPRDIKNSDVYSFGTTTFNLYLG